MTHAPLRTRYALAAFALTLAASAMAAAPKSDALALVPNDAATVGLVRLADLRSSPLSSSLLFHQTDKLGSNGEADKFLSDAGLDPMKDVDVLVVAASPGATLSGDSRLLIAAEGRFNVERLTKALIDRGAVAKTSAKGNYLVFPESNGANGKGQGAVAFPDARLVIMGTESSVIAALVDRANGGTTFAVASGLGREMARIDPHATAWALVDVARASRLSGAPHVPNGQGGTNATVTAALKNVSTIALWATDTGEALKLGAVGLASDEETLQLIEDTIRGALSALRLAAQDKSPDLIPVLRRFSVAHANGAVTISGSIPADTLRTLAAKKTAAK
ncbi:MAG TPA: hypothetical protein VEZ11_07460 [Thermoanaerobaculia bacterium]|nr:hypothetical protein [Thermoanaerobaculia bacterium]